MTDVLVLEIGRNAIMVTLLIAAPILGASLAVGLLVSTFQAATQINEMTLTFVPKILAVVLIMGLFAPWIIQNLTDYTIALFNSVATLATR